MISHFAVSELRSNPSETRLRHAQSICQNDYPLDWYQKEFVSYAEEYQALPDRKIETVLSWMRKYMVPCLKYFGDDLLLLAHYYMGGEIVKLVEHFGGHVGDSYQLALKAVDHPEKKIIVESAVHFMAESIAILSNPDQQIYITNPKAGCTMEMQAKDYMVEPAFLELNERYGQDKVLPICYMNTSGRLKAMTGAQGGAVCTSSNVKKIFQWALQHNKKILFLPDQYMGENVANWLDIPPSAIAYWPCGEAAANFSLYEQAPEVLKQFDEAQLVLFSSHCSVHSYYTQAMVEHWNQQGYHTIVHPECRPEAVNAAAGCGSTSYIWDQVTQDRASSKRYAIGTENHLVDNLKQHCQKLGIKVVNIAESTDSNLKTFGCGCATMSRNDPPHLVGLLDQLRQGNQLEYNTVAAGDVVNEFTGTRQRFDEKGQAWLQKNARIAMENMIRITKS